jgi:hypothetical protein
LTRIEKVEWPEFGQGEAVSPWQAPETYAGRLEELRTAMRAAGLTHVVVYGDREHFGNLLWCAGLDPRFEEALLLLGLKGETLLIVGNEGVGYAPVSPAVTSGLARVQIWPELSLPDQPRSGSRTFEEFLREERVDAHARVGVVGWKPAVGGLAAPGFVVDALRFAAGWENVMDFTRPVLAMRAALHFDEAAYFEWTNTLASEGMKRVLGALEPGVLDFDMLRKVGYPGVPLGCHMTFKCGENLVSLGGVRGERVRRGGRYSCGICYWGANICRAGWVVERPEELPDGYLEEFAFPYFEAMAAWMDRLQVGAAGGVLHEAVAERFGPVKLNAGHLIHYEEWLSSPVRAGSEERIPNGCAVQSDVIPAHPKFGSSIRMEDGYLVADARWRAEFAERWPEAHERCGARRSFLRERLGLPSGDDVLPLSNLGGLIAPLALRPGLCLVRPALS